MALRIRKGIVLGEGGKVSIRHPFFLTDDLIEVDAMTLIFQIMETLAHFLEERPLLGVMTLSWYPTWNLNMLVSKGPHMVGMGCI